MDSNQVDQLLLTYASKIPAESYPMLREKLLNCENMTTASFAFAQLKDPTTALILSILIGELGIDRFYVGDIGIGIGKLITFGACGIWWFIDLFLIMAATRRKNLETLMLQLR